MLFGILGCYCYFCYSYCSLGQHSCALGEHSRVPGTPPNSGRTTFREAREAQLLGGKVPGDDVVDNVVNLRRACPRRTAAGPGLCEHGGADHHCYVHALLAIAAPVQRLCLLWGQVHDLVLWRAKIPNVEGARLLRELLPLLRRPLGGLGQADLQTAPSPDRQPSMQQRGRPVKVGRV